MPQYAFENQETGEVREFFFRMADVPSIGASIVEDGRTWVRLASQTQTGGVTYRGRYPIEAMSIGGTKIPGCEVGPNGGPIIRSRAHAKEVAQRLAHTGIVHDD